ncbi:MAG TPA: type II secretion system protein [Pyrinomonadaceae bacterium]|nr:type II secretion system protein [Pyrinomonadaceae bacterium]
MGAARRHKETKTRRCGDKNQGGASPCLLRLCASPRRQRGFTLIELVMTLAVLTILTLGVIPLIKVSVKRQREQQLREALREMRLAIEEFHRDTIGMQCTGTGSALQPQPNPGAPGGVPQMVIDPRSRVVISDCTIFGVDNPDRYPPELETLVEGVNVMPRAGTQLLGSGPSGPAATENRLASLKKKIYLRAVPVDPMTGRAEWDLRSSYDAADATSWGGENVFDVRSRSNETALNGEKYSDW